MTGPEIDLVHRLRNLANWIRLIARTEDRNTCDDAADEIERLRVPMEHAAKIAEAAFDDRPRIRSESMDWTDGFLDGTRAAAAAIRAAIEKESGRDA